MGLSYVFFIKIIKSYRMKSLSLVTSDAIRKNQTNNSTSKLAFAFSKTKRFP